MEYKITNVKVSLKIEPISLDNVKECKKSMKKNFLVVREKYTYSIYKTSKTSNTNHINITGIPSLNKIEDSINNLHNFLDFKLLSSKIDNIIANFKLKNCIDLISICEKKKFPIIKYNSELFPGAFVKFDKGSAILFHTGSVVVMGCKSEEDLKCLIKNIYAVIQEQ